MAAAELVQDNPEWPMPGFDDRSSVPRRLRVWRLPNDSYLAVVTERGPGTSITNVAARAHRAVAAL